MDNLTQIITGLLIASLIMHIYSLYCLRNIARKVSYWRNKAVSINGMVKKTYYEMKNGFREKEKANALDIVCKEQ